MVAQHPQAQAQAQAQAQQPASSAQDEGSKRNTDCVYFLASPLTCKKGNECEYRHSEYARVNPRDCYYWLNGNCLNPKCTFRHPPLDGLLGSPASTAGGPTVPPSQVPTSVAQAPYNSSKQAVPCIFFQKGLCLKGDRCAFAHGPNPNAGGKVVSSVPVASQGTEAPSFKKPFGGNEKYTQERKTSQGNFVKSVGGPEAKPAQKVETIPQRNNFELEKEKRVPLPSVGLGNEASRFKMTSTLPVTNGPTVVWSNRPNQVHVQDDHSFHNGKDNDEFFRESSPGFDVLVADELRNSDYYHGEDEFGKARGPDERDSLNEYDLGHSADYSLAADIDQERFRAPQRYDSYDHTQDPYMWEQHRKAPAHLDRRPHRRSDSPDNVEVSDLRHRLSKRRRVNGLKSVVSHDYAHDSHGEEQSHHFHSHKDSHQLPLNESSISNRFRGRIKLPANSADDHPERESDRGRIRSRLSSGRALAPHQVRLQDRIRGRVQDDDRRNFRERSMGDRSSDFAGPKSLAELKNGRSTESKEQQSLGKRKSLGDHLQSEDDFQFEGPKPLSEILKEKRKVGAGVSGQSSNKNREIIYNLDDSAATNTRNGASSETKEDTKNHLPVNEEESKLQVTDTVDIDNTDGNHDQTYEDGMIYDEAAEDQEYEGDDQRDGDYDYEQVDEGEYEYEQVDEGKNPEQEYGEDEEDGDGDEDFAKKIGVMAS